MDNSVGESVRVYQSARDRFLQDLGVHKQRKQDLQYKISELESLTHKNAVEDLALQILESVSSQTQEMIKELVDRPVTVAIQTVYNDSTLGFRSDVIRTGDRMEINFLFSRGSNPIPGPILDSEGGGLVDVASFVLRLCLFRLEGCTGPLILDEPFRHVDKEALVRVAQFAQKVSHDMGIQLIIVTHEDAVASLADNTIRLIDRGLIK